MKNFFKKLSLILAIAMVIGCMTPATASAAAKDAVVLAGKKTALKQTKVFIGGQTVDLDARIDGKITTKGEWKSSKKTVATVDADGVIKPVANGTTTVTFTADDGKKVSTKILVKTRACNVNVYDATEYAAGTKNNLRAGSIEMVEGETKDLKLTLPISKKVKAEGGKKSTYKTYVMVEGTAVTAKRNANLKYTLTAAEAGEATVTFIGAQADTAAKALAAKISKKAEVKVTVKAASALDAKQTGSNTIKVTGSDLSDKVADYKLTMGTSTKALEKAVKAEDGSVVLTASASYFADGTYTLTFGEASVELALAASKVTKITIEPECAIIDANNKQKAYTYYHVYNQFVEDITKKASDLSISGSDSATAGADGKIEFTTTNNEYSLNLSQVSVSVVDKSTGVNVQKILTVQEKAKLKSAEFAGIYKAKGAQYDKATLKEGNEASDLANVYAFVTGVDQYGLEYTKNISKDNLSLNFSSITGLQADMDAELQDVEMNDVTYKAIPLKLTNTNPAELKAGEVKIIGVVLTSGEQVNATYTVEKSVKIDKIKIFASGDIYQGEVNELSYQILDTDGNEVTDIDTLASLNDDDYLKDGEMYFVGSAGGKAVLKLNLTSPTKYPLSTTNITKTYSWMSPTYNYDYCTVTAKPERFAYAVIGVWTAATDGDITLAHCTTGKTVTVSKLDWKYEDQYGNVIDFDDNAEMLANAAARGADTLKLGMTVATPKGTGWASAVVTNTTTLTAVTTDATIKSENLKVTVTSKAVYNNSTRETDASFYLYAAAMDDLTNIKLVNYSNIWAEDADKTFAFSYDGSNRVEAYYGGQLCYLTPDKDYKLVSGNKDNVTVTTDQISINDNGKNYTKDNTFTVLVKDPAGTTLTGTYKTGNADPVVTKATVYSGSTYTWKSKGYVTVAKGAYIPFENYIFKGSISNNYSRAIEDGKKDEKPLVTNFNKKIGLVRITVSNLPSDTAKYTLKDNGANDMTFKFEETGWYTIKVKYAWDCGFVYEDMLTFEVVNPTP